MAYEVSIVEDLAEHAEALERALRLSPRGEDLAISHFASARALADHLAKDGRVDICFMDINLGDDDAYLSGIQAVANLFPRTSETQVVYVTGYSDYHASVYSTRHVGFLPKPVKQHELDAALAQAIANLEERCRETIAVTSNGRLVAIDPAKILYVESARRKAIIHLVDEVVETYAKLGDLERSLSSSFVQCHKSFLVNMNHVRELTARSVLLSSGEVIPVSRQRKTATREAFLSQLRSCL